ncbi:MAG: hypothetical protein ABR909_01595 [Candidatus Bathyarchaeia archaeon]|jgi:hypothetical protein
MAGPLGFEPTISGYGGTISQKIVPLKKLLENRLGKGSQCPK